MDNKIEDPSLVPIDTFQPAIKTIPAEVEKLIELLADPNNKASDIDDMFGWASGECVRKLRLYPLLRRTVEEARVLGLRRVGLEKEDCYKVYKDATLAVKTKNEAGEMMEDHEVRIKAADRVLVLMGENPLKTPSVSVAVGVGVILSDVEREELGRLRGEVA